MAGFIQGVEVEEIETTALNTKVNKEIFEKFKVCCLKQRIPMNVVLETFMKQFANGRFRISSDDILKFKNDGASVDTLSTTFNKEIYLNFKLTCKTNGYFLKYVITAFMEKFVHGEYILEFTSVLDIKRGNSKTARIEDIEIVDIEEAEDNIRG